ncbi:MAG: hypothetical protein PVG99_00625 [Desulfobacteraceae bacterium]|jgi:hypothetical protein
MKKITEETDNKKKTLFHANGKPYFDKKTERSVFFFLTIPMRVRGLTEKSVL